MPKSLISLFVILFCFIFAEAQQNFYLEHKVRWMENIYTISKKYGVDPNAVLEYNGISAQQIRRGIIIRIPVLFNDNQATSTDSLRLIPPILEAHGSSDMNCFSYTPSSDFLHRVSLILPFQLQETQPKNEFLEFYEGFLLALEDLKEGGMNIKLSSYDSGKYPNMSTLVQSGALIDEELVVGPVYANELIDITNSTYGQKIKIISPLDPQAESVAYSNPNFFQVNTSLYWQQFNIVQHLLKNTGMVWLIFEENGADLELVNIIKDVLRKNHIVYREFIHRVVKEGDVSGELSQLFIQRQNNQVIVASTDEAFVSDILRNLYIVHSRRNCPITLYGNVRWRNFESVDLEHFHSMNLHLPAPNYVDYQKPEVKRFVSRFRAFFRAEPSAYAFQGYDVGTYFLHALHTKGPSFEYCMEQGLIPAKPLQSNFRFEKVAPDGGYINTGMRIIRYLPDYRIEVVN
jgi:hypothetical protein